MTSNRILIPKNTGCSITFFGRINAGFSLLSRTYDSKIKSSNDLFSCKYYVLMNSHLFTSIRNVKSKKDSLKMKKIHELAWLGDAVLGLYAREIILSKKSESFHIYTEKFQKITSNEFLLRLGKPTEVEAKIGEIFKKDGIDKAYKWLDKNLLPHIQKEYGKNTKKNL